MNEMFDRVCALVDLNNVYDNMEQICSRVGDNTAVYAVIKADGYGHGAIPIAFEYEKIDKVKGYCVATAEEALQLKKAGVKKDIVIIGYTFPYAYKQLIENDIRITVFREDTIEELDKVAAKLGRMAHVHIKVDTGMSRIGVSPYDDGFAVVEKAVSMNNLDVEGVFTHFAKADESDKTNANEQFEMFTSFVEAVEEQYSFKFKVKHCANSAAIIDMPYTYMDAVRAGIILYGLWPSDEVNKDNIELKPVMSIISHITYIKTVAAGTAVSYGGDFVTSRPTRIATIPVGYADGYQRRLSNKAYVIINGKKAPILGRICMDQFMVDVTFIPECKEGDKVTLIGKDGDVSISIEELSDISQQLNYEFACDIGKRVPRVFIKDNQCIYEKDYNNDVSLRSLSN